MPASRVAAAESWQSWVARIEEAVAPRIGSVESRREFAEALLRDLGGAFPAALRLQERAGPAARMAKVAERARDAVGVLQRELETNAAGGRALGVWSADLEATSTFLTILAVRARANSDDAQALRPPRRGRPEPVMGIEIARVIARVYRRTLGQEPKHRKARAEGDARLPFDRVCDVVETLQRGRVSISDVARERALRKEAAR